MGSELLEVVCGHYGVVFRFTLATRCGLQETHFGIGLFRMLGIGTSRVRLIQDTRSSSLNPIPPVPPLPKEGCDE